MVRLPVGTTDPYLTELIATINAEFLRREPLIVGWLYDGTDLHVRFRAALATPWVQVHVQSTQGGEGGATYDTTNYTSTTETDCRSDRLQDVTVTSLLTGRYFVFLVPVQYDAAGTKILYDGEGGNPDNMAFMDIGV